MNLRGFGCVTKQLVIRHACHAVRHGCNQRQTSFGRTTPIRGQQRQHFLLHATQTSVVTIHTDRVLHGPLCEREGQHETSLRQLVEWWQKQCAAVDEIGDAFFDTDGGPTAEELKTELNWLLDDAVCSVRSSGDEDWQSCLWRRLESEAQRYASGHQGLRDMHVMLREDLKTLGVLWQRRLKERVPLQYLTSTAFWRDIVVAVGPGVLIPRPETEQLIDFAQEAITRVPPLSEHPWADLGSGSGVVAICMARLLPNTTPVWAVESSPEALPWTQLNVDRHNLSGQVSVVEGEWCAPLQHLKQKLAGILTNPPYIPRGDLPGLQAEVHQFEPHVALDGGPGTGMNSLSVIAYQAAEYLMTGGFIAVETGGVSQAEELQQLLKGLSLGDSGDPVFENIQIRSDLFGVERFVTAFKKK